MECQDFVVSVLQVCIVLALFDILKISIVLMLPLGIFYGSQALNTIKKIQVGFYRSYKFKLVSFIMN